MPENTMAVAMSVEWIALSEASLPPAKPTVVGLDHAAFGPRRAAELSTEGWANKAVAVSLDGRLRFSPLAEQGVIPIT